MIQAVATLCCLMTENALATEKDEHIVVSPKVGLFHVPVLLQCFPWCLNTANITNTRSNPHSSYSK